MSRYLLRYTEAGCEVYDSEDQDRTVFGPGLWEKASRKLAELNTQPPQPPAAPCCGCGCAERLTAALEHYLAGMAALWPTLGFVDQQEVALRTIAEARQILRGGENGSV